MPAYKIMIMGASYGSLLASKVLFGGHSVHLICLPAEADLINSEGFRVRMPIRGRKDPVLIDSRTLPGKVTAGGTTSANPTFKVTSAIDLVSPGNTDAGIDSVSGTPVFTWAAYPSAQSYDVEVFDTFGNQVWSTNVSASQPGVIIPPGDRFVAR